MWQSQSYHVIFRYRLGRLFGVDKPVEGLAIVGGAWMLVGGRASAHRVRLTLLIALGTLRCAIIRRRLPLTRSHCQLVFARRQLLLNRSCII